MWNLLQFFFVSFEIKFLLVFNIKSKKKCIFIYADLHFLLQKQFFMGKCRKSKWRRNYKRERCIWSRWCQKKRTHINLMLNDYYLNRILHIISLFIVYKCDFFNFLFALLLFKPIHHHISFETSFFLHFILLFFAFLNC